MKNGLLLTLSAAAISFASPVVHAMAPVISDPGDVIVGDAEHGYALNEFVFEDAINLGAIATDDTVTTSQIKWSYFIAGTALYSINGANVLADGLTSTAVLAPAGSQIQANDDADTDDVKDANGFTATFRNISLSPVGGPNTDPGVIGTVTTQTQTVSLYASDGTTASKIDIIVYSANDTSDSIDNGSILNQLIDLDFENNSIDYAKWLGAVLGGAGSISSGVPNGLCMTAPLTGNNTIGWVYVGGLSTTGANGPSDPGGLIKLVDGNVWQVATKLGTDQTTAGSVPLLDFSYDNTVLDFSQPQPVVEGSSYAGEHIVLDNSGSANMIGGPVGRTDFQFWIAPAPMQLAQWRGLIDAANSAFAPVFDDQNDMNPTFRIIDADSAGINAQADSGQICIKHITISSASLASLRGSQAAMYNLPITTANWAPANSTQSTEAGTATISGGVAHYQLTDGDNSTSYVSGSLKTLFPFVLSLVPANPNFANGDYNLALNPILWESNHVLLTEADVRSEVGGAAGTTEGTAPVDVVQVSSTGPTTELVSQNFAIRGAPGSPGNMNLAGSPRLAATLTGAGLSAVQNYVGITFTHNTTAADVVAPGPVKDGNHLNPQIQFLNSNGAILGAGTNPFGVYAVQTWDLGTY